MSIALSAALANYSSQVSCLNTTCKAEPDLPPALAAAAGTVSGVVSAVVAGSVAGAVAGCCDKRERAGGGEWERDSMTVHICAHVDDWTLTGSVAGAVAGSTAPAPGASVYQLIGATQFMVRHMYARL